MRRWFEGGTPRLWAAVATVGLAATFLLGVLAARGSWYADDLDFLIQGSRGFGVKELLTPVNDHIAPGLRLAYAFFAGTAPLNYGFTVLVRCVVWCAACLLMAGLLQRLFGRAFVTVGGTAFYALAPMAMPSFMSLSSAVNNLPAHVLGLAFLHCTLDWFERRSRMSLLVGAVMVFGSLLFWEKSVLIIATAGALVLVRFRLRGQWGAVWAWVAATVVPLAGFAWLFLSQRHASSGRLPDAETLGALFVRSLARAVLPALVGGPWHWSATTPPYFGFAAPPGWVVAVGTVVIGVSVTICLVRRPRLTWLWVAVLVYAAGTVVLVSFGRFATFGETLTMHYHYWSDAAIPLTLALAGTASTLPAWHGRRAPAVIGGAAALCWLAICGVTLAGFAELWGQNPAGRYVATLRSQLGEHARVNLWNTAPPPDIMPVISNNRTVSGLLPLLGSDASVQESESEPSTVTDQGDIVPASLVEWASGRVPADCGMTLHRSTSITVQLSGQLPKGLWFAKVGYLSNPDARVSVALKDPGGPTTRLEAGDPTWPAGLSTAYLRAVSEGSGSEVVFTAPDQDTNLCIGSVTLGLVEPAP